jgi:hypothetical protein
MFMLIQCLVNALDINGFLSTNTTWSLSDESTMVGSLTLNNEDNATAILITHIVFQSFAPGIKSWSFLSFLQTGNNEYVLSIVLSGSFKQQYGEVVWAANGDKPVSSNGILELQSDGNLVLSDSINGGSSASGRRTIWSTNTGAKGVTGMRLFGGGVLQINDAANATLWQSGDNPTDTLLLGQFLRVGDTLVSRSSPYNLSQGIYSLQVRAEGLGLYVRGTDPASSELYWMWNIYNKSALALDQNCSGISFNVSILWPDSSLSLRFLNFTSSSVSNLCDISSFSPHYYLSRVVKAQTNSSSDAVYVRLDYDGNLRGYAAGIQQPFQLLSETMSKCQLPTSCGKYGICSQEDQQCKCPNNGTHHIGSESNSYGLGCELSQRPSCANVKGSWQMFSLAGMEYFRNRYAVPLNMSTMEKCSDYCLKNCSCIASFYVNESKSCFVISSHLGTLAETSNEGNFVFIKVQSTDIIRNSKASNDIIKDYYKVVIAIGVAVLAAAVIAIFFRAFRALCRRSKPESSNFRTEQSGGVMYSISDVMAKRFSFKEIRTFTNSFGKVIGSGGFGTVYEGVLQDGTMIAVKKLEIARQGAKEFYAEVAILGIIHHWNLVRLLGFCAEESQKILVYEHMPNGSLDRWLFDESKISFLTWPIRFNIVLGTARGLAYLHQECRFKIIHLDVKPQNILLDENFVAKVSDFGMATLMNRKESRVVTTMRGTPGYLAPEWLLECSITEKSDIYSFGMVVLEIIAGHKNYSKGAESDKCYFPAWALSMAVVGKESEVIDLRLAGDADFDRNEAIRVLKIGFLCIQEDAHSRPSMREVVQMLEGEKEVPDPPLHGGFQFAIAKGFASNSRLLTPDSNSSMESLSSG